MTAINTKSVAIPATPARAPFSAADDEITLLALVNALLRRRATIVFVPLAFAVGIVAWALVGPRKWESTASFSVQAAESPNRISGLAAQFGLTVAGSEGAQSPAFFVELVQSREILRAAALASYDPDSAGPARAQPLSALFKVKGADSAQVAEQTIEALREATNVSKSRETGVVTLTVSTRYANLSYVLVTRLVQLVDEFNRRSRQSQATRQREFVERRLSGARTELKDAEDRMQDFASRNRQFENVSQLRLQQDRLDRDVSLKQSLVTTLSSSYEQARIDEIRDMPAIMIIDHPYVPSRPETRGLAKRGVLALVIGIGIAIAVIFIGAMFNRRDESPEDESAEFRALWRETKADLTHPWRPLTRLGRR